MTIQTPITSHGEMLLGAIIGLSLLSIIVSGLVVLWFHRVGPGAKKHSTTIQELKTERNKRW